MISDKAKAKTDPIKRDNQKNDILLKGPIDNEVVSKKFYSRFSEKGLISKINTEYKTESNL